MALTNDITADVRANQNCQFILSGSFAPQMITPIKIETTETDENRDNVWQNYFFILSHMTPSIVKTETFLDNNI